MDEEKFTCDLVEMKTQRYLKVNLKYFKINIVN